MAESLSIVRNIESEDGPKGRSPQFVSKMRKKAKDLARQSDSMFMELGRILFIIWNASHDGTNTGQALFEKWGYSTFAEYVEKELNIGRRRAERLRKIWYVLEVECKGIKDELKSNLISLGTTKLRELCRVLDSSNANYWYEAVKDLNVDMTRQMVSSYLSGDPGKDKEEETDSGLPRNEIFSLYPSQKKNLDLAIEAARILANRPNAKKGHCLDLICMDFVATNDVKARGSLESRSRYISKMEQSLGVRFIAVDENGDVVHGMNIFEELAEE